MPGVDVQVTRTACGAGGGGGWAACSDSVADVVAVVSWAMQSTGESARIRKLHAMMVERHTTGGKREAFERKGICADHSNRFA